VGHDGFIVQNDLFARMQAKMQTGAVAASKTLYDE
jgi:hypothetical protein